MTREAVVQDLEEAWSALGSADTERAFCHAQRARAAVRKEEPLVFEVEIVVAAAHLACRSPIRAEAAIAHALSMPARPRPRELQFLSIEVNHAVVKDPVLVDSPSVTAEYAAEAREMLQKAKEQLDGTGTFCAEDLGTRISEEALEVWRDWYRFLANFIQIMWINGRPELAAAAAHCAWELDAMKTAWEDDAVRSDIVTVLGGWAWAEHRLAAAEQSAHLADVAMALDDVLARSPQVSEEARRNLVILGVDTDIWLRKPPSAIAERVQKTLDRCCDRGLRTILVARLGVLAASHGDYVEQFIEAMNKLSPEHLDSAAFDQAFTIAKCAFAVRYVDSADRWLSALETFSTTLDSLRQVVAQSLRAEIFLQRGDPMAALAAASAAFTAVMKLAMTGMRNPSLSDTIDALTYVRVRGSLDRAAAETCVSARDHAVACALVAFDEGRALRIELAVDRDDARSDHGPIGLRPEPQRLTVGTLPSFPEGSVACAFLWDNRTTQLGVFIVAGGAAPRFHWLELPFEPAHVVAASWLAARLTPRPPDSSIHPSEFKSALEHLVNVATQIMHAPFKDDLTACVDSELRAHRPRRIMVVPHGPLVGLPLHIPFSNTVPKDKMPPPAVSFAPTLLPLRGRAHSTDGSPEVADVVACIAKYEELGYLSHTIVEGIGRKVGADSGHDHRTVRFVSGRDLAHALPRIRAHALVIVAHGKAVGDREMDGLTSSPMRRTFSSEIYLGDATISTHDILRARHIHCDVVILCICSGARHIDPVVTENPDGVPLTWQIAFLDDPTMGIAGALLASGVPDVVAFAIPVDIGDETEFFGLLFEKYPLEDVAVGGFRWAQAVAEVQDFLSAGLSLRLAQHWSWSDGSA